MNDGLNVGYLLSVGEARLLCELLDLDAPPKLAELCPGEDGRLAALEELTQEGVVMRAGSRVVVDALMAGIMRAYCRASWSLTAGAKESFLSLCAGGGMVEIVCGVGPGRIMFVPCRDAGEGAEIFMSKITKDDAEVTARIKTPRGEELAQMSGAQLAEMLSRFANGQKETDDGNHNN